MTQFAAKSPKVFITILGDAPPIVGTSYVPRNNRMF